MRKIVSSATSFVLDFIETVVIGLSLFLVVYLFFMQPHQVSGQSMYPNFDSGDYVLTDKVSYRVGDPQRGDVVVFHAPPSANCPAGTGCDFIKRIIGLPGETVRLEDNTFYINNTALDESEYIGPSVQTIPGAFISGQTIQLGQNEYFVVGDNRPHSSDSRSWGPIQTSDIVGKAFFRYWPASGVGVIKHPRF